jgi:uncharacterized repeat protein (TIGR01451 family)
LPDLLVAVRDMHMTRVCLLAVTAAGVLASVRSASAVTISPIWPGTSGYQGSNYTLIVTDTTNDNTEAKSDITRIESAVDPHTTNAFAFFRLTLRGEATPANTTYIVYLDVTLDGTNDFVLYNKASGSGDSYLVPWNTALDPDQYDTAAAGYREYRGGVLAGGGSTNGTLELALRLSDIGSNTQFVVSGGGVVSASSVDFDGITNNAPQTNTPPLYLQDITGGRGNGTSDIGLTKSASDSRPPPGASVTYTVTVTNRGPDTASGIEIRDVLPAGLTYSNSVATRGAYTTSNGVWAVGVLSNHAFAVLSITARVDVVGWKTNTASVLFANESDTNAANDTAQALIRAMPTLVRLIGFGAFSRDGAVIVSWETAQELGTSGFYLERWARGDFVRVHRDLIPASPFSAGGAVYEQADAGASPGGTYTYRLIEVENTGLLRYLGPYTVTVDGPTLAFDEWSSAAFTAAQQADPAISGLEADPDGDGQNNLQEFLAGTVPTDPQSVLRIQGLTPQGLETVVLRWLSASNRLYTLERSTNLPQGFAPLDRALPATPPENTYTDQAPAAAPGWFYRVRIE